MGHGSCGAVEATIQGKEVPGQISALYPHIQPAVDIAGPDLEHRKANAKIQAALLRKASTVISGLVKQASCWFSPRFITLVLGSFRCSSIRRSWHISALPPPVLRLSRKNEPNLPKGEFVS